MTLPPQTGGPTRAHQDAQALFAAGRFSEAEQHFRVIIEANPKDVLAGLYLAQLGLLSNRLDEAEHWLDSMCQDEPAAVPLYRELYYRQDRWTEARPFAGVAGQSGLARILRIMEQAPPYLISGNEQGNVIPFAMREPLPVVRARVNGDEDVLLVIDTGAGDLILDRRVAERLNLSLSQPEQAMFAGGMGGLLQYAPLDELGLDSLSIRNLPVQVMEVNALMAGFFDPHGIDGIIGLNVLRHFDVQLDFGHGELRLYPPGGRSISARSGARCWIAGDHQLIAWGKLQDQPALWFLDSGMAGFSCLVSRQIAEAAGIDLERSTQPVQAFGGGGVVDVSSLAVERVCVDNMCRAELQAVVMEQFPLETHFGFYLCGLLAYDFFRPFCLELDFTAMRLRLT